MSRIKDLIDTISDSGRQEWNDSTKLILLCNLLDGIVDPAAIQAYFTGIVQDNLDQLRNEKSEELWKACSAHTNDDIEILNSDNPFEAEPGVYEIEFEYKPLGGGMFNCKGKFIVTFVDDTTDFSSSDYYLEED
jgi:hypothetical protein